METYLALSTNLGTVDNLWRTASPKSCLTSGDLIPTRRQLHITMVSRNRCILGLLTKKIKVVSISNRLMRIYARHIHWFSHSALELKVLRITAHPHPSISFERCRSVLPPVPTHTARGLVFTCTHRQ